MAYTRLLCRVSVALTATVASAFTLLTVDAAAAPSTPRTGAVAPAAAAAPKKVAAPTVDSVTKQLALLGQRNEQLTESFNQAVLDVKAKQSQAVLAQRRAGAAAAAYVSARDQMKLSLQAQYQEGSFRETAALLTSKSGQDYIDQSSALQQIADRRSGLAAVMAKARTAAQLASTTAADLVAAATIKRDALARQRLSLATAQKTYQRLLTKLTEQQRRSFLTASTLTVTKAKLAAIQTVPAPSHAAAVAVKFALAQRGKPYIYATSGPKSYDCSGLTAASWQAAGKSIPHQSGQQYRIGHHIAKSQLEPGDLVFFYSPIHHVALYIGNGLVVHAPTEGDVVKVVPLNRAGPYTGATRI